ncbi:MAG: cytochrome-c peroxidase [Bacteroidetes bacterium]|nr:MAG: cytochrome-c peroxidase [Bacteroidota bacterium]
MRRYLITLGFLFGLILVFKGCKKDAVVVEEPYIPVDPTTYEFDVPVGYPKIEQPSDNKATEEGIELGKYLFYYKSLNCVGCHPKSKSFSAQTVLPVEYKGKIKMRNPMPLVNLAWVDNFAWDGRDSDLETKIHGSIANSVNIPFDTLVPMLEESTSPEFDKLFADAFGSEEITEEKIKKALAQFLRTMIASKTRVHDYMAGDSSALNTSEALGFELFTTEKGNCSHCHIHTNKLFTDNSFRNNGLDSVADVSEFDDYGYGDVTNVAFDNGKFRSVTLINIGLSAPYMHDGRFQTLDEVLDHYNSGGKFSPNVDNVINENTDTTGLGLSNTEKQALVDFLNALTDTAFINNKAFDSPY